MSGSLAIVGAGATGLAAAYLAARGGRSVTVLESSPSVGGLLDTFSIAGTRLEKYYHHFFTHDRFLLAMLEDLGIRDRLRFFPGSIGVHGPYGIQPFGAPSDLLGYRGLSPADKARFVLTSLYLGKVADWRRFENISAVSWFDRWAGRGVTQNLWHPLLRAKFGRHADRIPLSWMIGRLSQRMNSRSGTSERLGYLEGSLSVYLEALMDRLTKLGVRVVPSCPVRRVVTEEGRIVRLETDLGPILADETLFTQPMGSMADLFEESLPDYSAACRSVRYLGALCVVLELSQPLSATYWVNVTDPACPFTGLVEHTNLVPPAAYQNRRIVYLGRYFDLEDPIAAMSAEAITAEFVGYLRAMFPAFEDSTIQGTRFFRTRTAATLCDLGFSARVPAFAGPLKNMRVGNMAHVYPDERSLNNAIRVAHAALGAKLA